MTDESSAVSVVLPVRNEASFIAATLDSILTQDYSGPLEIVIADGMSTDGTRDIIAACAAADSRIRLVDNPAGRTPSGLNRAIAAATGEVIVRCDGHSELPTSYVRTAVRLLAETGAANVGGVQRAEGSSPFSRAVAYAMSSPLGVGDARFHYGGAAGAVDTVYLGAFRRDAVEAAGGFDESLLRNQDYELNIRLRAAGGTVYFDPRLAVVYHPRDSVGALARQYFQYGRWKRRVVRMHPASLRLRQLAPPLLVAGLVGSVLLAFGPWPRLGWLLPAVYTGSLVVAGGFEVGRRRDLAAFLLPVAVATMHLAWGCGFLVGGAGRGDQGATSPA
jgi:succinoglycan biosynthesis protein ExoA